MPEIQITGVHFDISDRIRAYVSEKLGGLKKFNPKLSKIHVTIHNADKLGYRVDIETHLPHGRDIIAPVAAQLSLGLDPGRLGPSADPLVSLEWPEAQVSDRARIPPECERVGVVAP